MCLGVSNKFCNGHATQLSTPALHGDRVERWWPGPGAKGKELLSGYRVLRADKVPKVGCTMMQMCTEHD